MRLIDELKKYIEYLQKRASDEMELRDASEDALEKRYHEAKRDAYLKVHEDLIDLMEYVGTLDWEEEQKPRKNIEKSQKNRKNS